MLFGYPLTATLNNWLHDCICEAIRTIHTSIDARTALPAWPGVLPHAHRNSLRNRVGLKKRLVAYHRSIRRLDKGQRDEILEALESENRIAEILSGALDCPTIDDLPQPARVPISNLFDFAFELLTDLDIRDPHYRSIYESSKDHVCPFCGLENFDAPTAPREDLDHYLAKHRYPFAAANLRNLVPMGGKCNTGYKGAADMIRRADGTRRVAVDPYVHTEIRVTLVNSLAYGGSSEYTPAWRVEFLPDSPAVVTWDEVLKVRERYCRDHLDPSFASWLKLFGNWVRASSLPAETDKELVACLEKYALFWADCGFSDRAFLKAEVFWLLHRHCQSGDKRLLMQLRDLVTPIARITV